MMCNLVQGTQSFSSATIQLFQLVLLKPHLNLNSVKIRNDKIEFFEKQTFSINMSTTRSQKRKNTQREAEDNVSEGFISQINIKNSRSSNQDTDVAGPPRPKSPRVKNSFLESFRASLKEEITSEIENLLLESQREMKLLRSETGDNVRNSKVDETENETRSFHTPTKMVRINSTQTNDPDTNVSRNMVTGVLTDSTNHPKRTKSRSQSQPAAKERPAAARTLFGAENIDSTTLPMPKALTAYGITPNFRWEI